MATASLLVFSFLSLAAAGLYLLVGRHAARASGAAPAQTGAKIFRFWWWGLSAMSALVGIQGIVAATTQPAPWVALVASSTQFLFVLGASVGLCALMSYLWFLHTGRLEGTPFFAFFYALVYVAAGASLAWQRVDGFAIRDYAVEVHYANPLPQEGVVNAIFYSLLVGPQILAALLYLGLYRRVGDRQARVRVVLVATSLLVLLVPTLLVGVTGHSHDAWWLTGQQALMLLTGSGVLLAHRAKRKEMVVPPDWTQASA